MIDLHVMSSDAASVFEPLKKTYAIRIFTPTWPEDMKGRLKDSDNYIRVVEYLFDDARSPGDMKLFPKMYSRLFDEDLARKMISDFGHYKPDCESMLVHCQRGKNRSPAVAIAFNEIFQLGHDSEGLKKQYPESNWYVYGVLKKAASLKA